MKRRIAQLLSVAILIAALGAPTYGQRSSACWNVEGAELFDSGGGAGDSLGNHLLGAKL